MPAVITIRVNDSLYLRDPEGTELGRKIIRAGIEFIDQHGFDELTFRKLADTISSTEASIYRYFKSKRQMLKYLVAWYWNWLDYIISLRIANIADPVERLARALRLLISFDETYSGMTVIDTAVLRRIIVAESARVYLTRQDKSVNQAMFEGYNSLVETLVSILVDCNKEYPFHHALASTLITSVHKQIFYASYLPGLSAKTPSTPTEEGVGKIEEFLFHLILSALRQPAEPIPQR